MNTPQNFATGLVGTIVNGKWRVDEMIDLQNANSTGGYFSIPYKVTNVETGAEAFMKVVDVFKALDRYQRDGLNTAEAMAKLGVSHTFEVKLMAICKEGRLQRIVKALDNGDHPLNFGTINIDFPFQVFEIGDGDTHKVRDAVKKADLVWWMKSLHEVAVGLGQLHKKDVAHRDLKPSNVIFFEKEGAKLADLGRSVLRGDPGPNDGRFGDATYAPPESIFGFIAPDWNTRFLAPDLYHLGSLLYFQYTDVQMTWAMIQQLPPNLIPSPFNVVFKVNAYQGSFADALPALEYAFSKIIEDLTPRVPEPIRDLTVQTVTQLCHPNPEKRGHPRNRKMAHGSIFSIERFVSAFHRLAIGAERIARV